MKRILSLILVVVMIFCFAGCNQQPKTEEDIKKATVTKVFNEYKSQVEGLTPSVNTVYTDKDYGFQLDLPSEGEEVAILHTADGDICIRFFPEAAPKAVENFKTHVRNGYYNGLTFHRVIKDFMIQGGDPTGTGKGGESIWGEAFEDEFDSKLFNIRGALSMANSGVNTNGSQFFINQAGESTFKGKNYYTDGKGILALFETMLGKLYDEYYYQVEYNKSMDKNVEDRYPQFDWSGVEAFMKSYIRVVGLGGLVNYYHLIPEEVWDLYEENGGNIHLDSAWRVSGGHTVFGQVYEGMYVVDSITAVEVDSTGKPKEDVKIISAEIVTYKAK